MIQIQINFDYLRNCRSTFDSKRDRRRARCPSPRICPSAKSKSRTSQRQLRSWMSVLVNWTPHWTETPGSWVSSTRLLISRGFRFISFWLGADTHLKIIQTSCAGRRPLVPSQVFRKASSSGALILRKSDAKKSVAKGDMIWPRAKNFRR